MQRFFHKAFPINALPAAQVAGVGIDELSHSARLKSRAVLSYFAQVPTDLLFFFSDIAIQAEAMGAPVSFGPASMPSVSAPAKVVCLPRAADMPRMRVNAQVLKDLATEFPGLPRAAMVYGPFTVAGQVAGEQTLLRGVVEHPGQVRELLEKSLSMALDYARLLLETGAEVLWVSDPLAALLPPQNFWEFAGEYLARLFAVKGDRDTALHICGDTAEIVSGMVETGVGGISFDQCLDLLALEELVPPDVAVMGNIDPVDVLEQAPPEEVARSTEELVMSLGAAPNFALCPGCAPPASAPLPNMRAFLESGRRALDLISPHAPILAELSAEVLAGNGDGLEDRVYNLRADGLGAMEIMRAGLMRAIKQSSALYEAKRRHLPAVLLTVDAFYRGYKALEPELAESGESGPAVALGTVQGDFHEIGKNLVAIMLRAHGIPVLDLGVNVPPQSFVAACREQGCRVVGLSVFITSARKQVGEVMRALAADGLDNVNIVAGGAAINQHLASQAGAKGYAKDAVAAVRLLQGILKEKA